MTVQNIRKYSRIKILVLFSTFVLTSASILSSCSTPQQTLKPTTATTVIPLQASPQRFNTDESLTKPYVVLVSLDGFRYDYIEKFEAKNIAAIEKNGRRAESLIPAYPTKTFPNHYSIVTGMLPTTHGLIDNNFYDPKTKASYSLSDPFAVRDGRWYGGEPLWTVAERSGMIAASYFWVGSEAEIKGFRPSYYYNYDNSNENKSRILQIAKWLALPENERPHLLTLYFSLVDSAGHAYGPDSKQTADKVAEADELIASLRSEIANSKLPVNLILVSDHGMGYLDPAKTISLDTAIDLKKFDVSGSGAFISLHSNDRKDLKSAYKVLQKIQHIKAYWHNHIPSEYKLSDIERLGNIVIIADEGYYMMTKPIKNQAMPSGQMASHGWSNKMKDMQGIFLAEGPNIKAGPRLPSFENIHIYPFILKILNLNTSEKIDGNIKVLEPIYTK